MYYVPFADVKKFWDRMEAGGRKSFTYDEIDKKLENTFPQGYVCSLSGAFIHWSKPEGK